VRQQGCVGAQNDFAGLKYEYESTQRRVWVSTERGMSQQKCYMPKKS